MTELLIIADKMDQLTLSELRAIIAIFTEGRWLDTRDMMDITGMTRKSCIKAMESIHVKDAVKYVEDNGNKSLKQKQINQIRRMLNKLEADAK